jgi:hypothetical protein
VEEWFAVGPEPPVLGHGDQLIAQRLGQAERLQEPHDLVVEMDRARHAVDLREALERRHPMTRPAKQRGQRLADRAVPDDRHIDVDHQTSLQRQANRESVSPTSASTGECGTWTSI